MNNQKSKFQFNNKETVKNNFLYKAMPPKRHQDLWHYRPNNSTLLVTPSQSHIQNIYSFCQNFNDYLSQFVYTCMNIAKTIKIQDPPLIIDTQDGLSMVVEIIKEQKFVFVDIVSEERYSYKGYVSWVLLGTTSRLYVVDAARLHDQCFALKQVLQRKELIKFMLECQDAILALKRDWEIFVPNVFDLEVVQRHLIKQGKTTINSKQALRQHLNSPTNPTNSRPINSTTLSKFQDIFDTMIHLLLNLDKFFTTSDPSYQCYAYFNHYQFLLKSYYHHCPSVRERDELERVKRGVNSFVKYGAHQEISQNVGKQKENEYWQKDPQEEQIATMLCEWREHIAKMRDVNAQEVLPYQTVSKLSKTNINSILQISQLCTSSITSFPLLYTLSLQDFQQIFQLFQLHKQQVQQTTHELSIPRRLPYFKPTDEKPIKELFSQIKFTDVSNDWLNKKTDESVRLYKEIVSINQFDNSIVEEYVKEMTKNSSILNVEDVNKYVKYSEYLRMGNHKRLQEVYEKAKTQNNSGNATLQEQYFEENFIQGDQYKNWDEIQEEINFPTMDTINQPKSNQSLTSLKSMANLGIQSCKHFMNPQSTSVLKEKQLNSLRLLESPSIFSKIEPLPENIEAIYLEAARAKKSYVTKGQKKNNKAGKKQTKTKIESNSKKQQEFVPKKEEIFNLVYY